MRNRASPVEVQEPGHESALFDRFGVKWAKIHDVVPAFRYRLEEFLQIQMDNTTGFQRFARPSGLPFQLRVGWTPGGEAEFVIVATKSASVAADANFLADLRLGVYGRRWLPKIRASQPVFCFWNQSWPSFQGRPPANSSTYGKSSD